jgi:hypothetical protein
MTSTRRSFAGITACMALCPTSALGPVLRVNALVSSVSSSLRRGPGLDFHLLTVGHAVRTSAAGCRRHFRGRGTLFGQLGAGPAAYRHDVSQTVNSVLLEA